MKVFASIFIISNLLFIYCVKFSWKTSIVNKQEAMDDIDMTDFQKLLNRFNLLSNQNTKNYLKWKGNRENSEGGRSNGLNSNTSSSIPRMRFTELDSHAGEVDKDENLEAMDFEIKFPNDKESFIMSGTQDKEIKRKEGLSNGLVLCSSKRTLNVETSDFSYLYFDLLEN